MINKIKDVIYNIFFREKVVITENNLLDNQVVIITGASKGIGRSTAEVLSKMGAKLVLVSRDVVGLQKHFKGNNYLIYKGSVANMQSCRDLVDKTIKKFGRIDVLFNNAGIFIQKDLDNISEVEFDNIMNTNIKGVWNMTVAVIPFMKKTKNGLIINMGSSISHNSNINKGRAVYALTKYAIEGLSNGLRRELASFGIRVSCLMPGTVKTFRSHLAHEFISPYVLAEIISLLIRHKNVSYETLLLKSLSQDK